MAPDADTSESPPQESTSQASPVQESTIDAPRRRKRRVRGATATPFVPSSDSPAQGDSAVKGGAKAKGKPDVKPNVFAAVQPTELQLSLVNALLKGGVAQLLGIDPSTMAFDPSIGEEYWSLDAVDGKPTWRKVSLVQAAAKALAAATIHVTPGGLEGMLDRYPATGGVIMALAIGASVARSLPAIAAAERLSAQPAPEGQKAE